jgi:hypothetical protein
MNGEGAEQAASRMLRQGDILEVGPGLAGKTVGLVASSCTVALLSQTCDIAQSTKPYCLAAPVDRVDEDDTLYGAAAKGRRPLRVPLCDQNGQHWVADVGRAFPVRKADIGPSALLAHCAQGDHDHNARVIRSRIARAYGRFPFPDEVAPVFKKLQDRLRSKAGGPGHLGQVLDLVQEVRVSADQWELPGRELRLFLIVSGEHLIPDEDADPSWTWGRTLGWERKDSESLLTLDRACDLLLMNADNDATTTLNLWRKVGERIHAELLVPFLNDAVSDVEVEVVSDEDFTLRQFNRSESLDLETLSDSFMELDNDSNSEEESNMERTRPRLAPLDCPAPAWPGLRCAGWDAIV